jgi:hypothetical protein
MKHPRIKQYEIDNDRQGKKNNSKEKRNLLFYLLKEHA